MQVESSDAFFQAGGAIKAFSENIVNSNVQNTNVSHYYNGNVSENQNKTMIQFFREKSVNYRRSYDAAAGLRTPGTGQWFLNSKEYLDWKNGRVLNLASIGIPGVGKTVMSAAIIGDLQSSQADAAILYIFNEAAQEKMQTFQLFVLNFISQVLEQSSLKPPSPALLELYDTYSTPPPKLPNQERAVDVLKGVLAQFPRTFIVIDALDEYRISNAPAQQQLVRDLELLNASLLITSRHSFSFAFQASARVEIRATPDDVRAFVTGEIRKGLLNEVFSGQPQMAKEVTDTVVKHTDGIFLSPKLLLQNMVSCETMGQIKALLGRFPRDLDELYASILELIEAKTPWVLRLLRFLMLVTDLHIGARAILQYVACDEWTEGAIADYMRPVQSVLASCRGLVVLKEVDCEEDGNIDLPLAGNTL